MKIKHILIASALSLIVVSLLRSQTAASNEFRIASQPYVPAQPGSIRVQSTIVDLNVVVRDAKGQVIDGLKKEDFAIYDQGKKQDISLFNVELAHPPPLPPVENLTSAPPPAPPPTVPPRYLGFYFDDVNMSTGDLVFARKAAEAFVRNNMETTDRAGVFTSSTTETQQFTSDKPQILEAIGKLVSHQQNATFGSTSCPKITPYQAMEIMQSGDSHSEAFDTALEQAVQCHCSDEPGSKPSCIMEQSKLIQTQAATTLAVTEQFAQDSLGVLGDVIRSFERLLGQRILIMFSSGFFSKTDAVQRAQDKMIIAALKAGVVINALDAKGLAADWPGGNPADGASNVVTTNTSAGGAVVSTSGSSGATNARQQRASGAERDVNNDAMTALAVSTGGKFFHNSNELAGGLIQIAALPGVSYAMAFAPEDSRDNGTYHKLSVKLAGRSDVTISARPGYFAPIQQKSTSAASFQKMNDEVMASETLTGLAADVSAHSAASEAGQASLKVTVHVAASSLSFKKANGLHSGRVIFITALFDMQGHYLAGIESVMDMALKDATFSRISKEGVETRATLQAPPGTYRLREVVQEVASGRLSASSQTVEIH